VFLTNSDGERRTAMMKFLSATLLGFCVGIGGTARAADADKPWTDLFDGKTLDGWEQLGGTAKYSVEDGAIVGTTTPGSPNSFLGTKRNYGNFELELDFKVDPKLNSGVQIRSERRSDYKDGRVHGYQVEIDPGEEKWTRSPANRRADGSEVPSGAEPRRWTGGIYDESRRGWLRDLTENEAARKAFKPGEWNHFRIVAQGDVIDTWLNGVHAAHLKDGMTPNGFIALQVHSVESKTPLKVRWKNIRIRDNGANDAPAKPADEKAQGGAAK